MYSPCTVNPTSSSTFPAQSATVSSVATKLHMGGAMLSCSGPAQMAPSLISLCLGDMMCVSLLLSFVVLCTLYSSGGDGCALLLCPWCSHCWCCLSSVACAPTSCSYCSSSLSHSSWSLRTSSISSVVSPSCAAAELGCTMMSRLCDHGCVGLAGGCSYCSGL
jgi:hypothetical protein